MGATLDTILDPLAHSGNASDFSFLALVEHADPVVQAVILGLILCSVASWAIIIAKGARLHRLAAEIGQLEAMGEDGVRPLAEAPSHAPAPAAGEPLCRALLAAATQEFADLEADGADAGEARARLTAALREAAAERLKALEGGLPFLATMGSAAPFVGLFGTVWGIMHSFTSIAQARDTSLAVVAPGIAEALFATAIGLFVAIPAVIAYNQFATRLGRAADRIAGALPGLARLLLGARQPERRRQAALR